MRLYLPVKTMFSRTYCSIPRNISKKFEPCSLDELANAIEYIYNVMLETNTIEGKLTYSRMKEIQSLIRNGKYTLSPMKQYFSYQRPQLTQSFILHTINVSGSNLFSWIITTVEDKLVLMGLAHILNERFMYFERFSSIYMNYIFDDYYEHIRSTSVPPISRVYLIDLSPSLQCMDKDLLLKELEPIVSNAVIMKLLKDFFYIKLYHIGVDSNYRTFNIIPSVPLLTRVLLNFHFIKLDIYFIKEINSNKISYYRNEEEVIITSTQYDPGFEDDLIYVLGDLNIEGDVLTIRPGDTPLPCQHDNFISLTNEGRIHIQKKE